MLETTVIGSYPQPGWLLNKPLLRSERVARVRRSELWKIGPDDFSEALDDAVLLAVRDMEEAGIDIITDGEIGRESYSNHFLAALAGVEMEDAAEIRDRRGRAVKVPRVTAGIERSASVEVDAANFLRANTRNRIKVTLPGPFTMAQQCQDEHYGDTEALAHAFAAVVNQEARDLATAGVDVIQIDEPWFRNDPDAARRYGARLVDRAFDGVDAVKALHMCFGYGFLVPSEKPDAYEFLGELSQSCIDQISIEAAQPKLDLSVLAELAGKTIILGVLDLSTEDVESVDIVADRIRAGLRHVEAKRLMPAPDCGMKYLSREAARGKLRALGQAAARVRAELS